MARRLVAVAVLAAAAHSAAAWDSRNVSDAVWACGSRVGGANVSVTFPFAGAGGGTVSGGACGGEVLQNVSGLAPIFALSDAGADVNYTLLVIDRDATSAADPSRSPIRHMAVADVPGARLAAGVNVSDAALAQLFAYSGPQPPPGTLCHRYYAFVYAQPAGGASPSIDAGISRLNWNFTQWAANFSLSQTAAAYWRTQSLAAREGGCDAAPPAASPTGVPSPAPSRTPSGAARDAAAPALAALAAVLAAAAVGTARGAW